MNNWTPRMVEARLVEAALVLDDLPEKTRIGYARSSPAILCRSKQPAVRLVRSELSRAAVVRMEETLDWTASLDPVDGRIVWRRARGERWKVICRAVDLQRSAAHERWLYALCVIAGRLNMQPVPRAMRVAISEVTRRLSEKGTS